MTARLISHRLRWITLITDRSPELCTELERQLGLSRCHFEAELEGFGISSAVFTLGADRFLEVCGPVRADASAARHLARRGPGVYMVVIQVPEVESHRARLDGQGTRIVLELDQECSRGHYRSLHLHPADTGAALLSLDVSDPPEDFVGLEAPWRDHVRTAIVDDIPGIEVVGPDPADQAARWSAALGVELGAGPGGPRLELDDAAITFSQAPGPDRVATIRLCATDRTRAGECLELGGTLIELI